jgi:hypothetical protein
VGSVHSIEDDGNLPGIGTSHLAPEAGAIPLALRARPLPQQISKPIPPWLWWNVLSLDAPAVAGAWALLFARVSGIEVSLATIGALVLAVWLIYVADRLFDGWRATDESALKERHRFCQRHQTVLCAAAGLGTIAGVWLARYGLDFDDVKAGILLGGIVGVYLICVHLGGDTAARIFPKEVAVGLIFAAGTTLPVWSQPRGFSWSELSAWALFGLLCVLNCVAIECWENQGASGGQSAIVPWANGRVGWFAVGLAALSLVATFLVGVSDAAGVAMAMAMAAILTLALHLVRRRLSSDAIRVLADAALLVPAVAVLAARL